MDGLQGLEALGNAGAVPIIIFLTQLIKKKIGDFRYGSDLLALLLSFGLCTGWEFYYMTEESFKVWSAFNGLQYFHWGIDQVITGFATWLAAFSLGDRTPRFMGRLVSLWRSLAISNAGSPRT